MTEVKFDVILGTEREEDTGTVIPPGTYIEVTNNANNVTGGTNPNDVVILQQLVDAINNLPTSKRPVGTFEVILGATAEYPKAIATNAVNALQQGNGSGEPGPYIRAGDAWRVKDTGLVGSGIEVDLGDWIIANVDNAGNNDSDWYIDEGNSPIVNLTRADLLTLISFQRVVSSQNYRITDRRNAVVMGIAINAVSEYTQMLILNSEGLYNTQDEYLQCNYDVVSDEIYFMKDIRGNRAYTRVSFANLYNFLFGIAFGSINSLENIYYSQNLSITGSAVVTGVTFLRSAVATIFNDTGVNVVDSTIGGNFSIQETSSVANLTAPNGTNVSLSGSSSISNGTVAGGGTVALTDGQVISAEITGSVTCNTGGLIGYGRFDGIHNVDGGSFITGNYIGSVSVNLATNSCFTAGAFCNNVNFNLDAVNLQGGVFAGAVLTATSCFLGYANIDFPSNITLNAVNEYGIRVNSGYSNLETIIDITGLSTLNLTGYLGFGRFRLSSTNTTETLTQIVGYSQFLNIDILPEPLLTSLKIDSGLGIGQPRNEGGGQIELNGDNGDRTTYIYNLPRNALFELYTSTY